MVIRTLFTKGIPKLRKINRVKLEKENLEYEGFKYEYILPKSIDLLLVSIGEDGQIVLMFP